MKRTLCKLLLPEIRLFIDQVSPARVQSIDSKLPDTEAGRRVAAYIKAFNASEQPMREFMLRVVEAKERFILATINGHRIDFECGRRSAGGKQNSLRRKE